MPEYLAPGVYVEEMSIHLKPIEGVPTSTAGFIGPCHKGPIKRATLVTSLADFERTYGSGRRLRLDGGAPRSNYTWHAVRAFFKEGGRRLYVARVPRWKAGDCQKALKCFEATEEISIVAAPGSTFGHEDGGTGTAIAKVLIEHAERMRYRFAVLDSGPGQSIEDVRAMRAGLTSSKAALYYPWVRVKDPRNARELSLPPSGFVAGIYARVDLARGASKPPANEVVKLAVGLDHKVTEASLTVLNSESINCIRAFAPRDFRVWGGRTLSADSEWKYVNVRRLFIYLEASIDKGTQWAVFEPNAEPLWAKIRRAVEDFLTSEWRSGRLPGSRPEEAFFVKCDRSTMTQADIDQGRLICVVGVAVVRPSEFVIFRIGQWTADRPPSHHKRRRRSARRGAR
ncbi:MAG: phage tail sheath subtilisin-like domain-containing protein [Candidatus Rokubacteria bacterium]|nr:phage tail sheath subtilisin-like domain-containing protein [Candidatus Rokubacteria bacterium]